MLALQAMLAASRGESGSRERTAATETARPKLQAVTSGRPATREEGPQQPSPPDSAYENDGGRGPIDDDILF